MREEQEKTSGAEPAGCPGSEGPWSVLVAEDSPFNQRLAEGLLEKHGYRVVVAGTAREALDLHATSHFDVVLMDVELPDMDGLAVTAEIRRREKTTGEHLPIIAMTAHSVERCQADCLAAGMNAFLTKPLRANEMLATIAQVMSGTAQPSASEDSAAEERVNWSAALRAVADRRSLMLELIELFFQEYPELLARIDHAIAAQNAAELELYAHRLKGSLRYFGDDTSATRLASMLEESARAGQLAGVADRRQALESAIEKLLPELRRYAAGGE